MRGADKRVCDRVIKPELRRRGIRPHHSIEARRQREGANPERIVAVMVLGGELVVAAKLETRDRVLTGQWRAADGGTGGLWRVSEEVVMAGLQVAVAVEIRPVAIDIAVPDGSIIGLDSRAILADARAADGQRRLQPG